ncbi:leucine-rich repeat and IQ domain-containing protein 3-like [Pristis pectinata]|uniref:leucine-rich repeat and IQ domain-containing protein 3-like n=1 Tax=Pristis pectinata TaxID=685728 RepID=UPI00223D23F8|nr:leucine-rich repeat and IQ domain-containing protein 3-like [Pristis pectinata]
MKYLQVLYLHDNIIGDVDNTEALSACPRLTVLTLFDTPVSLMPKYRHFIVNNIWSLKALDNFVIADEEVMEDNLKSHQFRALSRKFFIYPPVPPEISTWCSELENIRNLMATINNILAHHSPVHIIQRWIRGHLTRKRLRHASNLGHRWCLPRQKLSLCNRGIHMLADGRMWVEEGRNSRCNTVQLQIDLNKLHAGALEDRYEAREITSGIYPHISRWKRWESPNLRPQRDNAFKPRTFRQPRFDPSTEYVQLV